MVKIVDLLFRIYFKHHKGSTPWILNLASHIYDPLLSGKILLVFGSHCYSVLSDHIYFPRVAQVPQRGAGENWANTDLSVWIFTVYHSEGSSFALSKKFFSSPTMFWPGQVFLNLPHKICSLVLKSLVLKFFCHLSKHNSSTTEY